MDKKKEVLVFGSGVSGLIVSYYLNKNGAKVSIVDPYENHTLKTLKFDEGLVELAANSILMNEATQILLNDIGLEYMFYGDAGKRKYFFRKNELKRWPIGIFDSLKLTSFFIKYKFFKKNLAPKKNQTLKEWSLNHLPLNFYERVFKRALQGVYGPNVDNLSSYLVMTPFLNQTSKSIGSVSFKNGMSEFTDSLKAHLKSLGVEFLKQEPLDFKGVRVVSTPAHSLPEKVQSKKVLEKVSYHNISTVTLFMSEKDELPFSGFGVVFEDELGVLGLILNSDLFPNRASDGLISETWILDGSVLDSKDKALSALLDVRKKMSGKADVNLVKSNFKNWPKAFPIYDLNLESVLEDLNESVEEDTFYFANWTGSLGIGRMIAKGESFANKVLKRL